MLSKKVIIGCFVSLGLFFGVADNRTVAQIPHETHNPVTSQTSEFQRIKQPLWVKGAVTASGLGLIALEIWWFLLSKPQLKKAEITELYRQK
jgi:plastocyanin domain-containing protein